MKSVVLLALAAAIFAACGDNNTAPIDAPDPDPGADAAPPSIDAGTDAGIDAMPGTLGPCLDRPTDLQRPPTGQLPCDLIPPGLSISQ